MMSANDTVDLIISLYKKVSFIGVLLCQ